MNSGAILSRRRCAAIAAALCVGPLVSTGCGEGPHEISRIGLPVESILHSFGTRSDSVPVEVLSRVGAATLSESGRYLAIADRAPPFLRLVDLATDSTIAFGNQGGGPGELSSAYALAFMGDSSLLVLNGAHRVERFTERGEWVTGFNLATTGIPAASLAVGCGGRVFLYGAPRDHKDLEPVPWVHEISFMGDTAAHVILSIPGKNYHLGWGGLYGFDGTDRGLLLWHHARDPEVGYWLRCQDGHPEIWHHTAQADESLEPVTGIGQEGAGMALTLPDTLFAGAAAHEQEKILARRAFQPKDGVPATVFLVVGNAGCRAVELTGAYTLHDANRMGLVVSRSNPVPVVEVIDWDSFSANLTQVPCTQERRR